MWGGGKAGEGGNNAGELSRCQIIINQGFTFVAKESRHHCTSNGKLLLLVETYKLSYSFINVHLVIAVRMGWWAEEIGDKVFVISGARGEAGLN